MTRQKIRIALACCLMAVVFPTWSADRTTADLDLELRGIALRFIQERRGCPARAGMDRDLCLRHAEGREAAERAEIHLRFHPSDENRFRSDMARLDAHHAGERRRCFGLPPHEREHCMNRAREDYMLGKVDTLRNHRRIEPGWDQGGPAGEPGRGMPPHHSDQAPQCMHPDPQHTRECMRQHDRHRGR